MHLTTIFHGHEVIVSNVNGDLSVVLGYPDGSDAPLRFTLDEWRAFAREVDQSLAFVAGVAP